MRKMISILFLAAAALLIILFSVNNVEKTAYVSALNSQSVPTIVIDAGHGGIDGGAVGADKTPEKDINLQISLKLKKLFSLYGYNVIMTREDDRLINDEGMTTIRQQKVSDLRNRLAIVKALSNPILLSIHQNKFSQSQYSGAQVFYSPNNERSKDLALVIQETVRSNLQPENTREAKKSGSEIFLLYHAECPSVMVECGFVSNAAELKNLKDNNYQNKMAFSILCGVIEFCKETP